ncbi:MAG TPA: XrtA/PEP-CTERM system histidine kinase PrsK [Steroidobacter sp.]|nr:XrtA/PEP-CTERM system histidine kinase PrsK [Steroidobacter sp.]
MNSLGVISYGAAAAAYALLAVLLAVSWGGRRQGVYLIVASAMTSLWALLLAASSRRGMPALGVFLFEMLRNAGWLLALTFLAEIAAPRGLLIAARAACAGAAIVAVAFPVLVAQGVVLGNPLMILTRAGLLISLTGLVLLEQIYRNASEAARPALRYFVLGLGGLFAYDLFLYSQAELLRGITQEAWDARGLLNAFAAPFIAIAVRRFPQLSLDLFVSRHVVFYTTTFVGIGAYLLLMSAGGYYVREIGGAWGRMGQILFFAGALVLLAFLIGSSSLRRHARVFISKHFYRNKYDYRIEWLRFISTLSSASEGDVRTTSLCAIAQIFASPAGVLFVRDAAGGRFAPAAAWPMQLDELEGLRELTLDEDLPRFLDRTRWIVDLKEYRSSPDVYDHMELPEWIASNPHVRLISPLLQLDELVGFVLLYDPPPPFELTYEDRDLLKTVGRHVATHLAQHEADRRLAEVRQFEAYNRLTAFMMHDLKNSVAQLKLLVANAERHKRNPEFIDDAISTIANTVERMTRLIEQLRGQSAPPSLQEVELGALAREAVKRCSDRKPIPSLAADAPVLRVRADPERLTAVIEHLIRNAQDASEESGVVRLELAARGQCAVLTVFDSGCGMSQDFIRERLFRPFDSTKGAKGMGIGAYQVREYVRMIGGQVEVQSSPGSGTQFSITLPSIAAAAVPTPATPPASPSIELSERVPS